MVSRWSRGCDGSELTENLAHAAGDRFRRRRAVGPLVIGDPELHAAPVDTPGNIEPVVPGSQPRRAGRASDQAMPCRGAAEHCGAAIEATHLAEEVHSD